MVPCRSVSWNGPAGPLTPRTLEDVVYTYRTDTPNGFPYETEFWLYVRLSHGFTRQAARDLFVSLIWADDPQQRPRVWNRPFQTVTFRPARPVLDVAVSLPSLVFEGRGRYEFRLWHRVVRKWDRATKRRILARAHIEVEG